MQLGDTLSVDTSTILGFVRQLTGTLDNTSAFADATIKNSFNRKQLNLQADIINETPWQLEGEIYVDDLEAAKIEYLFPTGLLTIEHMEVDYIDGTNSWVVVNPLDFHYEEDLAYSNTADQKAIRGTTAKPFYRLFDNGSFWLDPPAKTTVAGGIKIWWHSKLTALSVKTDEPVLVDFAQEYVCYDVAIELLQGQEAQKMARELERERARLFERVINFYINRNKDERLDMISNLPNFI